MHTAIDRQQFGTHKNIQQGHNQQTAVYCDAEHFIAVHMDNCDDVSVTMYRVAQKKTGPQSRCKYSEIP